MPQTMMCYGGTVITVVLSIRLRRQNTFSGCATTEPLRHALQEIKDQTGIDNKRLNTSGDGRNKGAIAPQKGKGAVAPTKPKK